MIFPSLCADLSPPAREPGAQLALRNRVMAQLYAKPAQLVQAEDGEFIRVLQGVYVKVLRADAVTETALWRLDPGAVIPAHGHAHEEECLVISGDLRFQERSLLAGDFLGASVGERQSAISSVGGALLLIRSERRSGENQRHPADP